MSYLGRMNLDASAQLSFGQLVAGAAGSTLLGLLLALLLGGVLHAVLHAAGALQTRAGAERKFSWWLAVLAVGLGAVVGGWTGLRVGIFRGVVVVVKDTGPKVLDEMLQQALRGAGMTNFNQLDVRRLLEFVKQAETAQVPLLEFPGGEQLQGLIILSRGPLLAEAKAMLDAHAQQGTLALNQIAASLWPKVLGELAPWERRFRRSEIITGILWIVSIQAALALGCLALRLTQKPHVPKPLTPPKL